MPRFLFPTLASLALLAACDGTNPFDTDGTDGGDGGDGGTTDGSVIPAALNENLDSVVFDADAGTLSVDMKALDRNDNDTPLETYIANPALSTPEMTAVGYQTFTYQDDALDRMFVAIAAVSADGSVVGAVVMDGGQFNKFFGGAVYEQVGTYTPGNAANDTGLVSYAGVYAGLTNLQSDNAQLLPIPIGTNPALYPSQPAQIVGDIFINADFGDNSVNGAIYNQSFVNLDPVLAGLIGTDVPNVFLVPADIATAGTFLGTAELSDQTAVGSYGGTFGGTEASAVAGIVHLDGDWLPDIENEEQFGVFVLTQCGQPGEAAICDSIPVNP